MKMRLMILTFLFCCCIYFSNAQDVNTYAQADKNEIRFSRLTVDSTSDIANYVNAHYNDERDKVRAIYEWVIANLRYDTDSARIINAGADPYAKINVALKRRKGVCENFAAILNDICLKTGLASFVIDGYTKQSGRVDRMGHSWCAVSINKKWYLFDPTWDVGNMDLKFFMVEPGEFIESHMPFDPLWQFLNYPITHDQFYRGNTFRNDHASYFNFSDSVAAYMEMDSLHKFQSAAFRIQKNGLINTSIKENYSVVKMNIEMQQQDKQLEWYNTSMASLNEVAAILNKFIEYRNNQFTPGKPDSELGALLDGIDSKMQSSQKNLDEVDKSEAKLVLGTEPVRERIQSLLKKIQDQKNFLKRYLNTPATERKLLFY